MPYKVTTQFSLEVYLGIYDLAALYKSLIVDYFVYTFLTLPSS